MKSLGNEKGNCTSPLDPTSFPGLSPLKRKPWERGSRYHLNNVVGALVRALDSGSSGLGSSHAQAHCVVFLGTKLFASLSGELNASAREGRITL